MTTNGVSNVEDADMAECDGEKVVTMMDVLQEEQDFEDDANAVLGASDEKNCTYSKGYIKRQAIYACLTCCTEAKYDPTKRAGVCLACSLTCHENHELIELYTKRNFCCDCGNSKFNSHPCQFTANKNDLNEDNDYNQNFSGLYCTCQRPYPDPESTIEDDEMIQCIICEDWLHASHLDAAVPSIDQYSEMVCKACMEKNEFLHDYSHLTVNIETNVDVVELNGTGTKLVNGDSEKSINGADDSTNKLSDGMDVNKTLDEDKSSMNNDENMKDLTSEITVEDNKDKETDMTMEAENTEEPSQHLSNINIESRNASNTDTITEETSKPSENTLEVNTTVKENESKENTSVTMDLEDSKKMAEDKAEQSTTVAENKLEENTTVTEDKAEDSTVVPDSKLEETTKLTAGTAEGSEQECKETLLENTKESKESEKSADAKEESEVGNDIEEKKNEEPEPSTEISENKNETVEKTSENDKDAASKDNSNDSDAKQDTITSIKTVDCLESKTNNVENDNEINQDSSNLENTALTQDNVRNKADGMETDKSSSEVVSGTEINIESETQNSLNTNEPEPKIKELIETETNAEEIKDMKRKLSTEDTAAAESAVDHLIKKPKLDDETCSRPKGVKRVHKGATFWPSHLRQKLCTCSECVSMYKDLRVLFLIDPEDTVFAYETLGKERLNGRATQYEKGLEALSSLDRIQQINALTEYNKMKDKLLDFLKSFKDRKEVVKEEDIKAFFAGMKPKREPDGVYFCR